MNFNNYTIKSQEAIQQAHQLAQSLENQQIENEHILKKIKGSAHFINLLCRIEYLLD